MRRAIVILPGAFTSGNLFFGIWSIVEAARGNLERAAWFIVVAGVMDMLDGRIARMSRTGTRFGAELDSLVDVISFGVAPAMLLFHQSFAGGEWAWLLSFLYILAAALRLARFNVEQSGHAKSQFFGLPSPASGMTLATFWPFAQTPFFAAQLSGLWNWNFALAVLTIMCALLMVSHVPYPAIPRLSLRTWSGRFAIGWILLVLTASLYFPAYFYFPFGVFYIGFGLTRAAFVGLMDRLPEKEPLVDEEEEAVRPVEDLVSQGLLRFSIGRRRRRGGGAGGGGPAGGPR
jgi:CDP-diacylglycerol--serine O-phosphatidyltransferase